MKYFLLLILFLNSLYAHPHTFIDIFPTINNKNEKIDTIRFKWSFDEMTSQLLIMEFDQNLDEKLDKKEIAYIKDNYFDPLDEYGFYTDIKLSKKRIKTSPTNFTAKIENKINITYEFDIKIDTHKDNLQIEFYDQEMFTAFMLKKDFIKSNLSYEVVDVDNDFYFAYRLQFN